jgi:hypothetical protein
MPSIRAVCSSTGGDQGWSRPATPIKHSTAASNRWSEDELNGCDPDLYGFAGSEARVL